MLDLLFRDYIETWYSEISKDPEFLVLLRSSIQKTIVSFSNQFVNMNSKSTISLFRIRFRLLVSCNVFDEKIKPLVVLLKHLNVFFDDLASFIRSWHSLVLMPPCSDKTDSLNIFSLIPFFASFSAKEVDWVSFITKSTVKEIVEHLKRYRTTVKQAEVDAAARTRKVPPIPSALELLYLL